MNKKWILLISILIMTLLLGACQDSATEAPAPTAAPDVEPTDKPDVEEPDVEEPDVEEPVVLRVGSMYPQDCWNPFSCTGIWYFSTLVIEGLTDHGPNSTGCEGVPRLAETWEVSEDGRTWTIKLHEGITFSDGTPFNSETARWNFETFWQDPGLYEWYAETMSFESFEIIDELTFKYTTSDPIINSPDFTWQWLFMFPPSQWEGITGDELYMFESYPPIGTGPYVVTEHVPGSHIIYDAREDYYKGKPPIDRVIYTLYANVDAITSAILTGEIDITTPWLPAEAYDVLAGAPNITVEEREPYAGSIYWLNFNLHEEGIQHPAIKDPVVREAIDYAIDKQQLVDVALFGHGVVLPTAMIGVTDIEVDPELEATPFDLVKSAQLLDEAGYLDTDGDGIRETADGLPLVFRGYYGVETPPAMTMMNMIKDWLGSVGIGIEISTYDVGSFNVIVYETADYDLLLNAAPHDIDPAAMDWFFSCWGADIGDTINNSGYCNPELDNLVYEFWYSNDLDARWEPMYEAQRIMAEDRPIIVVAGANSIQAYRNDRFEFPLDTCDISFGMFGSEGLLNATVK